MHSKNYPYEPNCCYICALPLLHRVCNCCGDIIDSEYNSYLGNAERMNESREEN